MSIFRFEFPLALMALTVIPAYWAILYFWNRREGFPTRRRQVLLVSLALTAMITGLARPQLGHSITQTQTLKSQIFFAVDVSKSMLANDITPSRLAFAKALLHRLLVQLTSAKFAIYPFTQNGYLQLPLTNDEAAAADVIESLNPSLVSNQGTDLTQTLQTLFTLIVKLEDRAKASGIEWLPTQVLLISDGESHQKLDTNVLRLYRARKLPIHTVVVGTEAGGTIPAERRGYESVPGLRDATGRAVVTKVDVATMRQVAQETGGQFFPGQFEHLPAMVKALQQTAALGRLSTNFKVEQELFPWFFALALVCLLADLFARRWQLVLRIASLALVIGTSAQAEEIKPGMDDETRAITLYNNGVAELKKGGHRKAAELFQEAASLTQDGKLRKRALYNQGNALYQQMDPTQAIEAYQQARDTVVRDRKFEDESNRRISDNIALSTKLLEEMKKMQQQGKGDETADGEGKEGDQNPQDPKGPKQFQGQDFDAGQKKRIFDLIASEEQQTMQRMMEQRNKNQGVTYNAKPW